ncbi:MAG TPA: FAD-dependent oxidoreductase [Verrucomicrobiae bacterium]|nr:FAD-dependent oxidoreductase [Verrucomicrobiae bacterium]
MRRHSPLRKDIKCEVAIIGAGLTGALIAYSLVEAGFDVVLVDKRDVGQGSTSASTALILYEIDTPLSELISLIGRRKAERGYRICRDAIFEIERIVNALKDDCGFAAMRSVYLASTRGDVAKLKKECRARARAGFNVEYLAAGELRERFGLAAHGALLSSEAAVIDPYRFCNCLVESSSSRGLRVFGRTEIDHFDVRKQRVILHAGRRQITARKVVVAAGYESAAFLKKIPVRLKSTYAIATEPVKDWAHRDLLIWEMARPYIYLRVTSDGRILIGGEDENFRDPKRRDRLIPSTTRRLETKLSRLFPGLRTKTAYAWAGTFAETKDGLPYIDTVPGQPNVMYALCYGANGTNFAIIAAKMICDWVGGRPNADRPIFSFER